MPGPNSILVIVILIGWFFLVLVVVRVIVRKLWAAAVSKYTYKRPAPDAIMRRFQTFSVNSVNLGLSVQVAVDENYLHLTPLPMCQWLGTNPVSIPWDDIELVKPAGRLLPARARLSNGKTIMGPAWCLELASPRSETEKDPLTGHARDG